MPKKIYIRTYGCQMNVADSEWMRSILLRCGWELTDNEKDASCVLLNTCSVRALAEEKVFSKLGELGELKKRGKDLIIGVTGCMAQNYGKKIFDRAPYVNIVCGSYRFGKIGELIEKINNGSTRVVDIERKDEFSQKGKSKHAKKIKITSFVPVMRGCNNMCSYCIVPHVRGPERSRSSFKIIREIEELAHEGYKEITLLGQNVNSYKNDTDFIGLLKKVNEIDDIYRIRFVTSHPKDASMDLFNEIHRLKKVCESLHLPFQSGSNKILKLMNRGYTREHYLSLVKDLHGIALSADIIVGFPGETEEDFVDTYNLMKEVCFDSAFIFKYSERSGTKAAELSDNVPLKVKKERNNILLKLQDEISLKKNKMLIGSLVEVLVEGLSKKNENRLMGRTRHNKIVVFSGTKDIIGKLLNIKIVDVSAHTLYGERN